MSQKNNESSKKIKVSRDGPYLVTGKIPLKNETIIADNEGFSEKWENGDNFSVSKEYALCRCGKSMSKPFCDGSHIKNKFNGEENAKDESYLDNPEITDGPKLSLHDVIPLCSGARFCDRKGGTWFLTENSNKTESKKLATEQACNCPSGRLVVYDKKTGKEIEPDLNKEIGVVNDPEAGVLGPLWVKGGIPVESASGKKYQTRNRVTLCRCGKSKNKPFCDGSHISTGFKD